jgi:hypothetical protein
VLGTYVLLESALRTVGNRVRSIRQAVAADRARRPNPVPLEWETPEKPDSITIAGIEHRVEDGKVSGGKVTVWSGKPAEQTLPFWRFTAPKKVVPRPTAYWVPAEATEVIERLSAHGIRLDRLAAAREIEVEMDRLEAVKLAGDYSEGHVRVTAGTRPEKRRERFAPGSVRVPTDQPLGTLAVLLLDPSSPDSFFQWGFFPGCLERAEYAEAYVMEPMAERMLAEDPSLRTQFEKRLRDDPVFAASPAARLDWFYRQTPFHDRAVAPLSGRPGVTQPERK